MSKRLLALFGTVLILSSGAYAQVVVSMDTKDGDTISGDHKFRATVRSPSLVSQVEFYVDDNLVATDDSTPYEFVMDTLIHDDTIVKVTVAAYNMDGDTKRLEIRVRINNGLALGVKHHVDLASEALTEQRWADAVISCRVALKIDPEDNAARMAMARAQFGRGAFDLAQKFAEDVVADDPGHIPARELLAGINLRQAFRAMEQGTDRDSTITTLSNALSNAARGRRDSLGEQLNDFGAVTDENRLDYVDLLIKASRYSLAINELAPVFSKDERNPAVANRLMYAMLRAGRFSEAQITWRNHTRRGDPDAYGYALKAVISNWLGDESASADAEREALLYDPSDMGVRTSQAFLALRRGNLSTFASITRRLVSSTGFSPVTNYYLSSLYYIQGNFSMSESAFQAGLLADPSIYDIYLERFNQSISYFVSSNPEGQEKAYQLAFAKTFVDGALAAKAESFEALTALSILYMLGEKPDDALRYAQAATAAGPQYAAAQYTLAGAYFLARRPQDGVDAMDRAGSLDSYLNGRKVPNAQEAWRYFYTRGRMPLLAPPSG